MPNSTMPSPTSGSPRKTRSRSRLVSGHYEHGYSPIDAASPTPASGVHTPVPVMKASSMQPVPGHRSGAEKRARHKMTDAQLQRLEELYQLNTHPSREAKEDLAREVGMTAKSVLIWFQNRRQDRRRSTVTKTPLKPALPRAERAQGQKPHKPHASTTKLPLGHKNTAVAPAAKDAAVMATASSVPRTAAQAATAETVAPKSSGASKKPAPRQSTQTDSSRAENSMDDNDDAQSSPSTAPTSVRHLPRVARSPSSSLDSSSSSSGSQNALWRYVRASPPPPPPLPIPARRQALGNLQSNHGVGARHRPDLEWACANSAARRKHGCYVYRDEDDSDGESSELEGHVAPSRGSTGRDDGVHRRKRRRLGEGGVQVNRRTQVSIPREYEVLFPPDLVLGASLLLTLKHSAT
ncbi:hypothetical protein C8Q78DRAFT_618265 [Trametes maxima]|nr:hypothetical protein C8Q78DRAFT_618265 [Trametes maxima]